MSKYERGAWGVVFALLLCYIHLLRMDNRYYRDAANRWMWRGSVAKRT